VAHHPLLILGLHEEGQAGEDAVEVVALRAQRLLLARGRHGEEIVDAQRGRTQRLQRALDRLALALEACHVVDERLAVRLGRRQPGQAPAEPHGHLLRREPKGEDADELRLEIVGLVDDEQAAALEVLALPLSQGEEVGRVGAEDRSGEGGGLGARVGAGAGGAARPPAHALRRGDGRAVVALAAIVVTALDDLELAAEVALVLILEELLRSEQVGVAAPAGQRHRQVALAHARRRLDQQHARRARVVLDLGQRVRQREQQPALLRPRSGAGGKVLEQVDAHRCRATIAGMMSACRLARRVRVSSSRRAASCSTTWAACC
jgi:hypothetical protein